MRRTLLRHLIDWKKQADRKPLLIKGARQVGKSWLVQELGKSFNQFAEVNFDQRPGLCKIFEKDISVENIILQLSIALNVNIVPGETLLFLDEIQVCPRAISALRYFYEKMPSLHVIAAGSLVEFALEETGLPVGRLTTLYCFPLSFYEFLIASGQEKFIEMAGSHDLQESLPEVIHQKGLELYSEYMAIGGMPEAVKNWIEKRDLKKCIQIHQGLVESYREDFNKYARRNRRQHVELVFNSVPLMVGKKFVSTHVSSTLRAREILPALDLLVKAGVVHVVHHTSANGVPLGAEINPSIFKVISLDVALMQALLHREYGNWLLDPIQGSVNFSSAVEAFVGQEIVAYSNPFERPGLYYWARERRGANAEIDYVVEIDGRVVPLEVKSGAKGKSRSMHIFLEEKKNSPIGFMISTSNFTGQNPVTRIPLYAVWRCLNFQP